VSQCRLDGRGGRERERKGRKGKGKEGRFLLELVYEKREKEIVRSVEIDKGTRSEHAVGGKKALKERRNGLCLSNSPFLIQS
jgi:hypothetical protein